MTRKVFTRSLAAFACFTVVCGVVYTFVVTGVAQLAFPYQANGSVFETESGRYSELIGQSFSDPEHLWGRPVSVTLVEVDGKQLAYGAPTNDSPASEAYAEKVDERVQRLRETNPDAEGAVPVDLVTESGSGLDPQISVAAAEWQVPRIAEARGISEDEVRAAIERHTTHRLLGIFGEEVVNVLEVNLDLDGEL